MKYDVIKYKMIFSKEKKHQTMDPKLSYCSVMTCLLCSRPNFFAWLNTVINKIRNIFTNVSLFIVAAIWEMKFVLGWLYGYSIHNYSFSYLLAIIAFGLNCAKCKRSFPPHKLWSRIWGRREMSKGNFG